MTAATLALGGLVGSAFAVTTASAATSHAAKVVVSTGKTTKLGTFLKANKTLYTLKASKTACAATCLKAWPELVLPKGVKKATAGAGVDASKLGTIARAGGVLQVTYSGKPLYEFVGDKSATDVHGNVTDTWGTWSTFITVKPKASTGTGGGTSTGGNSGTGGVAF